MGKRFVTVNIARDDGSVSRYHVEHQEHLTVFSILDRIYSDLDRTIAYRHFCCKNGGCMSCLIKVNGRTVQACKHVVEAGTELWLEAANKERAIRDLVIELGQENARAVPKRTVEV